MTRKLRLLSIAIALGFCDAHASGNQSPIVSRFDQQHIATNYELAQIPTAAGMFMPVVTGSSKATLRETIVGDVNLDGEVNFLDIAPFIAILSSGVYEPEADFDQDGAVNSIDIIVFIVILVNG